MRIEFANGSGRKVSNEKEARAILDATYPAAEYGDWQWSGDGPARMLVWPDEASAESDDGAHAVAAIFGSHAVADLTLD